MALKLIRGRADGRTSRHAHGPEQWRVVILVLAILAEAFPGKGTLGARWTRVCDKDGHVPPYRHDLDRATSRRLFRSSLRKQSHYGTRSSCGSDPAAADVTAAHFSTSVGVEHDHAIIKMGLGPSEFCTSDNGGCLAR
jgi:hypothetical protein